MAEMRQKSRRGSKAHTPVNHDVKCVFLGDGDVGKTSFLLTYLCGKYQEEISPGPMDSLSEYDHLTKHPTTLKHENAQLHMTLVDTYGLDEYDKLRERICAYADLYVVCYDVNRPLSFDRIKDHWIPEFRRYSAPDTPFVVVGLKTDIRSKAMTQKEEIKMSDYVTFPDGLRASEQMGAAQYVECSAKNNTGVKRVMEKVAEVAALHVSPPEDYKRSSCVLS